MTTETSAAATEVLDRVLIVGAGPVGMSAALALGHAGVPVTILERLDDLSTESRASTFHPPTLELLNQLGVAREVVAAGLKAPITQYRDRVHGPIAELDMSVLAEDTPFPFRIQCEQHKLTRMIQPMLTWFDVDLRFGHHAVDARVDGDGQARVTVEVDGGDRTVEITAPWVIAADGAHSVIRESLGIAFEGETYPENFLVVSTNLELQDHLPDLAYVNYVADPDEWLVLLRTPDQWRILFPVGPDEDPEEASTDAALQARLHAFLPLEGTWPVAHSSLYVVNRRVAAEMRHGPFLLAGDAAHVNSPLGGMGMNSGVQDAISAARRLADVLSGRADESVLDEYDRNRRRVAIEFVGADSHRNWQVLREPDPQERARYQAELKAEAADPVRARERLLRAAMLDAVRESL